MWIRLIAVRAEEEEVKRSCTGRKKSKSHTREEEASLVMCWTYLNTSVIFLHHLFSSFNGEASRRRRGALYEYEINLAT